ncbi:unnamed protein product [Pieris macdunnoughi]|uniref:Carboxylesterase type B domain-containing protein n=1 Tax=Pieris macdunnoughi TaxID=345717 RepID=A0A821L442_9NEOP|nr:unnamed protein product [Pieris macdunnoughi]
MLRLFILFLCQLFATHCRVEVKLKQGVILGTTEVSVFNGRTFYAFYGVPYAQAPVGKLRFKNPVALEKSTKVFDATTEYRGACAQQHIVHKHGTYGFEDCLHLNIYTPYLPIYELRTEKAVIVWIHGYAFTSGFSHIHGGDFLIDNDVILVTLTHRISVFGFLKLNDTDNHTNMGLKDIVMGLKWIKKNIGQFGGNKDRLTVMASGSAATFISLLMMTKFRKLFSKVILQSGSIYSSSLFQGDPALERMKLEMALQAAGKNLAKASANDLVAHTANIYNNKNILNVQRPLIPFMPIQESESKRYLISKHTLPGITNLQRLTEMPIMLGFSSQESITEVLPFIHNPQYMESLKPLKFMVPFLNTCKYKYGSKKYKEVGDLILNHYFKGGINENSLQNLLKYVTDLHKYPIYKFVQAYLNATGSELFVYKFNYVGNLNAAKMTAVAGANTKIKGAAQGDEICYILRCDPLWENYVKLKQDRHNRDRSFITQIANIWANFAKYGKPTPNYQNNTWLPMTKYDDNVYLFAKNNKIVDSRPEHKMFEFWNDLYTKYYSNENCGKNVRDEM